VEREQADPMMSRYVNVTCLALAVASGVRAQEQSPTATQTPEITPTFPAQIEQVIVDVVVTGKDDAPVRGLTADDFIVEEDGVRQSIVSFEAVERPAEPAPITATAPRVSTNTSPEAQRGSTFVVVFDDVHLTPGRARNAKAAVASFLENGVREGDYVTLISSSGGTWWTSRMNGGREKLLDILKRLEGRYIPDNSLERLTDWEAMRIHVYRDPEVGNAVYRRFQQLGVVMTTSSSDPNDTRRGTRDDPFVTARAAEVYYEATWRNQATLDTLERALNGLAGVKGRKSVILASQGFIYDPNLDEFRRVNRAALRANAAIYFLNTRGLEGMPDVLTAEFGPSLPDQDMGYNFALTQEAVGGSENVAADSGGFTVRNTNDLEEGIERIARESRVYYLLGYHPTNTNPDGKFREIEVKLREGKGREIRARKGYYAPRADGSGGPPVREGVDPVIQAALDSPWPEDGIPLRMTAYVGDELMLGKASVHVVTEIDIRELAFETIEGREHAAVEFLLVVAHRESGEFFRYDQTIDMKLRPATRERLDHTWYPMVRGFELEPGDHQAKIVVREVATGKVGSVIHDFEVPSLEGFRVSTPILSDTRRLERDGQRIRPALLARRQFPQGGEVICEFEVFGAAKGEDQMPRVAQGFEVLRDDGTVFTSVAPSVMKPSSLGALSRIVGFSLANARPGSYEMLLSFRDELSGEAVQLREPFEVVPPYPREEAEVAATAGSETSPP
jgi:VWFA-related protein